MKAESEEAGDEFNITKISAADDFSAAITKDGRLYAWGKNDKGQLGVGSGCGIDIIESENIPKEIDFSRADSHMKEKLSESPVIIKDVTTGMNTMMAIDTDDNVYKTGLKIDYDPSLIKFDKNMLTNDASKKLACGERHYVVLDKLEN